MKRHVLNTGYGLFLLILACPLWACSYEEGRSYYRAKQYEKAHACFMQPENRQNPKAWNTLGIMYNNGYGVEKDERKAVEWYMKAAMNGYAVSQYNLACQYEEGQGSRKGLRPGHVLVRKGGRTERFFGRAEYRLSVQ